MSIEQIINNILSTTGLGVFNLFFKCFAIVFSIIYFLYAVIIFKQTRVMTKTLESKSNYLIVLISFFQMITALILLLFSFMI